MRKKLVSSVAALLIAAAAFPLAAEARGYGGYGHRGGYGHGGYGRGYGGYGRGYGGYYGGRGFFFPGAFIGFGLGYDYGYGYGPGAEYYGPGYEVPPAVAYAPSGPAQQPPGVWYYCPPERAYYPYVRECPAAWQVVPAQQPRQTSAAPVQKPAVAEAPAGKKTYDLGDVLFDTGKSRLLPSATWALDQLVAAANKDPEAKIRIDGYTDNHGEGGQNRRLSQQRADAVKQYLISKGIAADRMEAVGNGDASPVAGNDTPEGRQQNRRVDVTLG